MGPEIEKREVSVWVSTGILKMSEMNPQNRHVNDEGLGWESVDPEFGIERLAHAAYHAYGAVTDHKNYQGTRFLQFYSTLDMVALSLVFLLPLLVLINHSYWTTLNVSD